VSDDDVAREDVDGEFDQAVQMLDDARKAHEVGISKNTVVNRLYYCCFHAAQAALYSRDSTRSHTGRSRHSSVEN